jgi:hypothetical protein
MREILAIQCIKRDYLPCNHPTCYNMHKAKSNARLKRLRLKGFAYSGGILLGNSAKLVFRLPIETIA